MEPVTATRIACLGECMLELVERSDGSLSRGFGGDTLNTAVYMARLGLAVDYVTALGDDSFSDEMIQAWRREGIGTGTVLRVRDTLPGLYLIQTDANGERRFSYWRDDAPVRRLFNLPETTQIETALEGYDLVYLSGITLSLFGEAGRSRLFEVVERVHGRGGRVVFDSNFRPRGWPDRTAARAAYDRMLACSDIVLASVEDFALLDGCVGVADVVARLEDAGVAECVVKLIPPGCLIVAEGREVLVQAEPVAAVVDTTAAGDSFAAAYVAARCAGASAVEAARRGHRLAAAVVRHRGAIIPRSAMPENLLIPEVL